MSDRQVWFICCAVVTVAEIIAITSWAILLGCGGPR